MNDFASYCAALLERVRGAGWEEREQREIAYGRQWRLARRTTESAVLNAYHGKKGFTFVVAGPSAAQLAEDLGQALPTSDGEIRASVDPFELGGVRVGGDESGKGDYFGPLVAALYHVDEEHSRELVRWGIADCKQLSDPQVERLAGKLEETGRGAVVSLAPPHYNARYAATGNINVLLGELYAECWRALAPRLAAPPPIVLIDQFTPAAARLAKALALPRGTRLELRTKGERDVAVAAASVLARAAFVQGLREQGQPFGTELPAGSGGPVSRAIKEFARSFGPAALGEVAKLHFSLTPQSVAPPRPQG
ncbi:MAG: ribonuclease HIII [Planctomycetes bacterium]|nr:ribonuclease HIII [Planctomycetota bacterium]